MSSLIAMLLQYMAAKLGIRDPNGFGPSNPEHAQVRHWVSFYILTELAIMATDIAEVIGAAIAPILTFDIPLVIAVFITVLDVFVLLLLTKVGFL